MLITTATRHELYQYIPKNGVGLEIGVLKAENAVQLIKSSNPKHMFLVDSWSQLTKEHYPHLTDQDFEDKCQYGKRYFGGDIREQTTFDQIYQEALINIKPYKDICTIYKMTSKEFIEASKRDKLDHLFDYIYLDASHQYENVYWELRSMESLLKPGGMLIMNDVCWGPIAAKQNFGVLQAITSAIQLGVDYKPIALTLGHFSDLFLIKGSAIDNHPFYLNLQSSKHFFIDLPNECLFAYNHFIPTGWNRYVPSFSSRS